MATLPLKERSLFHTFSMTLVLRTDTHCGTRFSHFQGVVPHCFQRAAKCSGLSCHSDNDPLKRNIASAPSFSPSERNLPDMRSLGLSASPNICSDRDIRGSDLEVSRREMQLTNTVLFISKQIAVPCDTISTFSSLNSRRSPAVHLWVRNRNRCPKHPTSLRPWEAEATTGSIRRWYPFSKTLSGAEK